MLTDIEDHFIESATPKYAIPMTTWLLLDDYRANEIVKVRKQADVSAKVARMKFAKSHDEGINMMGRACHAALQSRVGTDSELDKLLKELNEMVEEERNVLDAQEKLMNLSMNSGDKVAEEAGATGSGDEQSILD